MDFNEGNIPILTDEYKPGEGAANTGKLSLQELEKIEVPFKRTLFNTCTRVVADRRSGDDRRGHLRAGCTDRRSGRERRFLAWN